MNSPFPGMDPYLESPANWEEFHHYFIGEAAYYLGGVLPPGYLARVGEHVNAISVTDEAAPEYIPDVAVARQSGEARRRVDPAAGGVALAEPELMADTEEIEVRHGYIEIRRAADNELVTAIELLSPSNKFGEGIGQHHAKRRELVARGVHVVEIDLLRRGKRAVLSRALPPADYYAMIFLGDRRPAVRVHRWFLRDRLPAFGIPLRTPDADVPLDLSEIMHNAYQRGRFERKILYDNPIPPPALNAEDATWVGELVGKREH
jgi:hypothetical protein